MFNEIIYEAEVNSKTYFNKVFLEKFRIKPIK